MHAVLNQHDLILVIVLMVAGIAWRWGFVAASWAAVGGFAIFIARNLVLDIEIGPGGYLLRATVLACAVVLGAACAGRRPGALAALSRATEAHPEKLTPRELEVLEMLVAGAKNAEIAQRLFISEHTVKSHVKHILGKLRARNRTEAVVRYLAWRESEEPVETIPEEA